MNEQHVKLSKKLSYILRHNPLSIGLKLDEHGWGNVNFILSKMKIDLTTLEQIVQTDSKQRYAFNDDHTLIRANQGHTIEVDIGFEKVDPKDLPKILFHGTLQKVLPDIRKEGLKPMSRHHVHLSSVIHTAREVAQRRHMPWVVLSISSEKMSEDGIQFYKSANGVWLTDYVDPKYILDYEHTGGN